MFIFIGFIVCVCVLGCVLPGDTTEAWITKNFGSFSVMAQLRDFISINGLFNGVLNAITNLDYTLGTFWIKLDLQLDRELWEHCRVPNLLGVIKH